jgi:acyl-CoA thioesterase I
MPTPSTGLTHSTCRIMNQSPLLFCSIALFCFTTLVVGVANPTTNSTSTSQETMARPDSYLARFKELGKQKWPDNRTLNVVFHGHSVPAGYFRAGDVRTHDAYPHLLHLQLKERYPNAVINIIVTAIGGEHSKRGAARFESDVLCHKPDVLLIDYALNDRSIGLEEAHKAWSEMIEQAKARDIPVILLTPTNDLRAKLDDPNDPLNQHAEQIRQLAASTGTALCDSFDAFKRAIRDGADPESLMSQGNHPNRAGHELVARELIRWFE